MSECCRTIYVVISIVYIKKNNIGSLFSACEDLEFAKTRARSSSTLALSRNAERSAIQAWCDRSSLKSVYGKDF